MGLSIGRRLSNVTFLFQLSCVNFAESMSAFNNIKVLIPSGAGAPGFAGIIRCLRKDERIEIFAGDVQENPYGKALADHFFVMPASSADNYVEKICEICKKHQIQVLLPITTRELLPLAKHKSEIEALGTKVVISDLEGLEIANNKGRLLHHQIKHETDIPVPDFGFAMGKQGFIETANQLFEMHDKLCFKPVEGNGSRGFGVIVNKVNDDFLHEKAGNAALTVKEWSARMPKEFEDLLMVCAYLPGVEYSVDLLCDHGKVLVCVPRTRDKMIGGISVAGTFENNFTLKAFCMSLVNQLKLHGPIGIQWKEDANGMPYLLEINPRLQGTTSACELAGVNFPLLAVKMALGEDLALSGLKIAWGKKFVRYWEDAVITDV